MKKGTKKPSAQFKTKTRNAPHNSDRHVRKSSAQFGERNTSPQSKKLVLTRSGKRRGPKAHVLASEVVNRAYDLRLTFKIAGEQLDWTRVLAAKTCEDVIAAFASMDEGYRRKYLHKPELILECLKDPQFPKQDRKAQQWFIADSLAADGRVSIRRSRDICSEERTGLKRQGTILRREFYIVCSCGYNGPALYNRCPDCRAEVSYADFALGFSL